MTIADMSKTLGLSYFCGEEFAGREITGGYAGDLLSWVMGKGCAGCAWITIMSNQNVAAVALLRDIACVILAENVPPDKELLNKAREKEIVLLKSEDDMFTLSGKLYALLER